MLIGKTAVSTNWPLDAGKFTSGGPVRENVQSPAGNPLELTLQVAHVGASIYQPDGDHGFTTYPRAVLLEARLVASLVRQRVLLLEGGPQVTRGQRSRVSVRLWTVLFDFSLTVLLP